MPKLTLDSANNHLQMFSPHPNKTFSLTSPGTYTLPADTIAVRFQPTAAVTVQLNGAGATMSVAAGATTDIGVCQAGIPTNGGTGIYQLTTLVFTGAATVNFWAM